MTILEIILIGVLWVVYGVFSAYQSNGSTFKFIDGLELVICVGLAPIMLLVRVVLGVFHKCTMEI